MSRDRRGATGGRRPLLGAGGLGLLLAFAAAPADAATVTNRDTKDYKLTVIEGDKSQTHVLKPAGTLLDICPKGCVVRLNDSEADEYELEGTEVVSIEEGYLYYDVPDAMPEGAPGAAPPAAGAPPAGGAQPKTDDKK